MTRQYHIYDGRAIGICGQFDGKEENYVSRNTRALVNSICLSLQEAIEEAPDYGEAACYSYKEEWESGKLVTLTDERWEFDMHADGHYSYSWNAEQELKGGEDA